MTLSKRITTLVVLAGVLLTFGLIQDAEAKKRQRVSKDPDAPTNREAKVLGWGPVKTPNRGKSPEFMIRGVILEVDSSKVKKGHHDIKILPIEVLNNHQRVITFDNFQGGVDLTIKVPKPRLKELKKGRMVEYNQYYTESVEQSVGGAKMVAMTLHKEIQGYPAGPGAYLKKPGFYPIQYKNAIKGSKLYLGNIKSDKDIRSHMDYLATKSKDNELKTIAKTTYVEIYAEEPTGRCKIITASNTIACN